MQQTRIKSKKRQRGAFYSTLILVALVGLFLTAGLKIAPAYIDNNIIVDAMEGIRENNNIAELGLPEIRTMLMRTLNTNNIRNFDAANVVLVREGAMEYIDINYETRVRLFFNIDAMVKFENRFDKT